MLSKTKFVSLVLCAVFFNGEIQSVSCRPFIREQFQGIIESATDTIRSIVDSIHATVMDKASTLVSNIATKVAKDLLPEKCEDGVDCDRSFLESVISKTAINLITDRLNPMTTTTTEMKTTEEPVTDASTTDAPTTDDPTTDAP
ncbi:PREDICTED: uncharacterized protein LOC108972417 [Bactrocera latifrons]|uniref:Uncharacterized protein n=1 Tax=Bactrocera latifrons TaxID=174628 RepID=A0A0K8VLV9_BACLA|nr:PREDICTED: uncharacterized protein LOC108972417 [Bactrocera latifrons]